MTDIDIERKVRQLDNDVTEIYSMLSGIAKTQQKHSATLADLGAAVTNVRAIQQRQYNRLDELDAHLNEVQGGLTDVQSTLTRQGNRLGTLEGKFDTLEGKFGTLEGKFDTLEGKVDQMDARFTDRFQGLDVKLDAVLARLGPPAS